MSMTDALGRIDEIRSTLTQLSGTADVKKAASASASSVAGSGAEFASTLSSLTAAASTGTGAPADGKVLDAVQKYLGLPYVWGGNDPAQGLDCSSFVQNVYKDLGYTLPRVTWDQMSSGTEVASLAQAQAGDLLFSHDGGHVAIYLGNGKAVDAPQPGQTIAIRDAWETDANLTTIRRILPAAAAGTSGTAGAMDASTVTDLVASARAAQSALMGSAA
ncbi:C40 family peptidase [Arthrobacter sp. zg-Y20]|uniref:C40 family peptidase n=1 Tax=unclassified Arthrobacter TaxID=235627 RepID=UPI001D14C6FF|nr:MULTISPECIES: C40 family peptidase [unclassified Arthrobacter]MCC3276459.1 C40 family peptidase [Arthrobacter sp. zg-Y20]MDK1316619.1 C40 family peptidase [Arthrobacter sp. zg.Y20]MDK1328774.1 C40 family peptidase [Arthrobacter sp. zg-Y1143]WIB06657.1 C40 family peptidase [Arthrobacter sp. zg-Y20]